MNNVPNLDAMSIAELLSFWKTYFQASPALTRELLGDNRRGASRIVNTLVLYAQDAAIAQQFRLDGNIAQAMRLEKANDARYSKLPADLKW